MLKRAVALCAASAIAGFAAGLWAVPAAAAPDDRGWVFDALHVSKAWETSKGAGVTVAVLSAGRVDDSIPELKGRVSQGNDMTGVPFPDERAIAADDGTAAASLIAGSGSGGLAGVAPQARLISIPVVDQDPNMSGGFVDPESEAGSVSDSPIALGIRYAVNRGATVISVPIAQYGVDRMERDAVAYALSRGTVIVSGVGDGGLTAYAQENSTSYWEFPAGYPGVVGVASVDRLGRPSRFSSDNLSVLVAAPGEGLPVTLPKNKRGAATGTGAASALVAGVAALIKSKYPDLSPELVSRALTMTARSHPRAGYDDKIGFGIVDAAAALDKAGELAGYHRGVDVMDDAHFGNGPLTPAPAPPGPDPVRLWIYGVTVVLGLGAFGVAVVALARR